MGGAKPHSREFSSPSIAVAAFATATSYLGLSALSGWAFQVPVLVQFSNGAAPIVVASTICLVIGGMGLFLSQLGSRNRAGVGEVACGFAIAVLAAVAAASILADRNLGLDFPQIHGQFKGAYISTGRMTPMSAFCFLGRAFKNFIIFLSVCR